MAAFFKSEVQLKLNGLLRKWLVRMWTCHFNSEIHVSLPYMYHCPYKFYSSACSRLLDSACSNLPSKSWPVTFLKCQSASSLLSGSPVYTRSLNILLWQQRPFITCLQDTSQPHVSTPFHMPHLLRKTCLLAILYIGYINHEPVR